MESLVKLFFAWEIQLLVLLSFTIQIFLFFTGGLRWRSTNTFLRFSIWIAYLGADIVAVYALGYLSQHEDARTGSDTLRATHPLAFFWAPFLLIHLGGQDTITAFSMEDNNLWLRHLLNLVMQVFLAVYVFWKSIGRHSVELIASGIFVFIAGIIKYGERTWSLKSGRFQSLEDSPENHYEHRLPKVTDGDTGYSNTVCMGLHSMPDVHKILVGRAASIFDLKYQLNRRETQGSNRVLKLLEIELGVIYNDLYTKALVLRTKSGIILRCISQICAVVAFVLFFSSNRQGYSRADIAITYSLFAGGFFLEVCAVIILMASPWTWAWLKAQKCDRLARFSWFLVSSDLIGWPEERPLWPYKMGQYNYFGWLVGIDQHQPRSFNQKSMAVVRKLTTLVGVEKNKLFWLSKLLDTENIKADEMMGCISEVLNRLSEPREWPNLGLCLRLALTESAYDFGFAIVFLHMITEVHLSKYPHSEVEANEVANTATGDTNVLVEICRKLSRYMIYLLVTHPSLLPLTTSAVDSLKQLQGLSEDRIRADPESFNPRPGKETLDELKEVWTRLVIYAAGKSRPELHAAQLAGGGEFLTFVWLRLANNGFGSYRFTPRLSLLGNAPVLFLRCTSWKYLIKICNGVNRLHIRWNHGEPEDSWLIQRHTSYTMHQLSDQQLVPNRSLDIFRGYCYKI